MAEKVPVRHQHVRILVVDDFPLFRELMAAVLRDLGFRRIEDAVDGETALAKLHRAAGDGDPFSIIFCDWNMPGINGLAVLNDVLSDPSLRNLIFVMVTAESEKEFVLTALKSGALDYIVKPISRETMARKLDRILNLVGRKVA